MWRLGGLTWSSTRPSNLSIYTPTIATTPAIHASGRALEHKDNYPQGFNVCFRDLFFPFRLFPVPMLCTNDTHTLSNYVEAMKLGWFFGMIGPLNSMPKIWAMGDTIHTIGLFVGKLPMIVQGIHFTDHLFNCTTLLLPAFSTLFNLNCNWSTQSISGLSVANDLYHYSTQSFKPN